MYEIHKYYQPSQINTFVYCKRRWYYQNVHKIFYHNDDTEIGKYEHENHWQNTLKRKEVYIESHSMKIKAKIDYLVEENGIQVPIEIKKGKCTENTAYENDIMQLVCYIMLFEEHYLLKYHHGYILYKGSKKKYTIEISDELRKKLIYYLNQMRGYENKKAIPKLEYNENKCYRCSIRDYCLI